MNDFMGNKERKQQKEKRIKEVSTYSSENGQSTKIQNAYLSIGKRRFKRN